MKKQSFRKRIASFIVAIALILMPTFANIIHAEDEIGVHVYGSDEIITERGNDASVTFTFKLEESKGVFNSCYAFITWDPSLMTYDSITTSDFLNVNLNEAIGKISIYVNYPSIAKNEISATINFTNVLPEGTTEETVDVNATFKSFVHPVWGETCEVSGSDCIEHLISEVSIKNGSISLDTPQAEVEVSIDPTAVTLEQGANQTFIATVINDEENLGVTWTVTGATSSSTVVDTDGNLVVGEDETATTVTVTATSVKDPTKSASAVVTVIEKDQPIDPVDPVNPVTPTPPSTGDSFNYAYVGLVVVSACLAIFINEKRKREEY